jgi:hypothetical protein
MARESGRSPENAVALGGPSVLLNDEAASSIPRATRLDAALRLILIVGYESTRLLKPWIPQAPSRIVNTMSPP